MPTCYRHPGREAHIRCQRCDRVICPECVAQGAKQTRQNRTAYGGLRPTDASTTSIVLIALNVAVWLGIMLTGGRSSDLIDYLALRANGLCTRGGAGAEVSASVCDQVGGVFLPGVVDGAYWQLVTSMFTHVQVLHIAFNMFALYVLGPQLEAAVGRARFLALYFVSGLSGSALVYWAAPEYGATLGASGAVFGLMGALAIVAFKVGGDVRGIMGWIAINFVLTFLISGISWQGHLGGFLGGSAIGAILVYAPRGPRRTAMQVAGTCFVLAIVLFAIAARTINLS